MRLITRKKVNSSIVVVILIFMIITGSVLYRITDTTATNHAILKIITPPMIGFETLYELALSSARGTTINGNEKYIRNLKNKKNIAYLYFNVNLAPLCKSLDKKADELLTILEDMPSSEMVKDAMLATANFRAGISNSGFAMTEFLEMPDEEYVKDYEAAVALRTKGLANLEILSKSLTGGTQEMIDKLRDDDEQLINHAKRVFEIQRGSDCQFKSDYLKDKLVYNR